MKSVQLTAAVLGLVCVLGVVSAAEDEVPHHVKKLASAKDNSAVLELLEKGREVQSRVQLMEAEHQRHASEMRASNAAILEEAQSDRGDVLRYVKGFWGHAIHMLPSHAAWTRTFDMDLLNQYLVDLRVVDLEKGDAGHSHFKITLTFSKDCPFFEEEVLWREIHGLAEDHDANKVSGVTWLDGKAPTDVSFFNFFESNRRDKMLETYLYNDIAHALKYELWENPMNYFDIYRHQEQQVDPATRFQDEQEQEQPMEEVAKEDV